MELTKAQEEFTINHFVHFMRVGHLYTTDAITQKLLRYGYYTVPLDFKDLWIGKEINKFITHEDIEEGQDVIKLHLDRQGFFGSQLFYDKAIEEYDNMAKNVEHLEKELKEKKRKLEELKELIEV